MILDKVQYFDDRFYKVEIDGVTDYYPSVTTKLGIINKPMLGKWRGDIGNREADLKIFEAQNYGARVHSAWESFCNNIPVIYISKSINQLPPSVVIKDKEYKIEACHVMRYQDEWIDYLKIEKFYNTIRPTAICSEAQVYSVKYKEAGTLDNMIFVEKGDYKYSEKNIISLESGYYICDVKTGNVYDEAYVQISAYAQMVKEMHDVEIQGSIIIHTNASNKDGLRAIVSTREELLEEYKTYRLAADLWERKNEEYKPKLFEFKTYSIREF